MIEPAGPHEPSLPPVDPSEIAFAMALFVAAAKGRVHGPNIGVSGFPLSENLLDLNDIQLDIQDSPEDAAETESVPLSRAVSVLWHHYKGDERQRTIWCRVVAFHVMMVSCQGSLVEQWTKPCREDEDSAFLDPAIVHAVATASLSEFGRFSDALFLEAVKQFTGRPALVSETDSPVAQEVPQFRLFESLRRAVADLGGRRAFDSLLSRALVGPNSKFPWLGSAPQLTPSELFKRIDQNGSCPSMAEAAEAETAVIASVIELLHLLLGESVTLRILQNAWADQRSGATDPTPSAIHRLLVATSRGQTTHKA